MNIKRIIREEIKNSTEEDWGWTEGISENDNIIGALQTIPEIMYDDYSFHTIYLIPKDLKNVIMLQTDLDGSDMDYSESETIDKLNDVYIHIYDTLQDATELFGDVEVNSIEDFKHAGTTTSPFGGKKVPMEAGNIYLYRALDNVIPSGSRELAIYSQVSGF